jgi:hypothetical protein
VELRGPANVPQPTFALLDRLEAESVAIEAPRAVEVLRGELGHGARRAEWTCHDGGLFRLGLWLWTRRETETHRGDHQNTAKWHQ